MSDETQITSRLLALLLTLTCLVLLACVYRLFIHKIYPSPQRFLVVGSSMMPHLKGGLPEEICPYCDYVSACSMTESHICANCRAILAVSHGGGRCSASHISSSRTQNLVTSTEKMPGPCSEILLRKNTPWERWNCVIIKAPEHHTPQGKTSCLPRSETSSGMFAVKRLVGMPGETVAFHDGHLYINNSRLARPLNILREMRILVHDSRFPANEISRWKELDKKMDTVKYEFHKTRRQVRWEIPGGKALAYFHQTGTLDHNYLPAPITTARSENGNPPRAGGYPEIKELMLEFTLESMQENTSMQVILPHGNNVITFHLEQLPPNAQVILSTLDGFPRTWINNMLVSVPMNSSPNIQPSTIKISGSGIVCIRNIILYRGDLYDPPDIKPITLGEDEYYLLGDNPQASKDSRQWGGVKKTRF